MVAALRRSSPVLLLIAACAWPAPARADDGRSGQTGPTTDHLRAEADFVVGLPYDELGDLTGPSSGLRLAMNYQLDERISLGLAWRWFRVQTETEGFEVGYWDLAAGGRYQQPLYRGAGAFFEFELLYGTVDIDSGINQLSEPDPGVGVRGGLFYWLWPARAQVWVHTGYSRLFSDSSVPDAEWLEVGGGLSLVL